MTYQDILYEVMGGVVTITINRPEVRNAVRFQTYEELTAAMNAAARETSAGVVVLTGAGKEAFCAGGDVREQKETRNPPNGRAHMKRLFALALAIRTLDKPVIAKVRGWCVGGGSELALFCDLAVASQTAKFGQPSAKVGGVPVWGECQLLARLVGERTAREMLLTGRIYDARKALEKGLVNEVHADEELDAAVDAMCKDILKLSPQSLRLTKVCMNSPSDQDFYGAFFSHAELLAATYGSEENMEGINAFLQKRPPAFDRFR